MEVLDAISELSKISVPKSQRKHLYRARLADQIEEVHASEFDITPAKEATEGRYNHAGKPAFYLGSDPETCFYEVRENEAYIAKMKIHTPLKIFDLINTYESHPTHSDLLDSLVYSALISSRQPDTGWDKPKYVFSRFIADCAKYCGFDAIKYPSTRITKDNFNLVILNSSITIGTGIELIEISKFKEQSA